MAEKRIVTCDECGTEKGRHDDYKTEAWLLLKNPDLLTDINSKVRLDRDHHFCSFGCLNLWSNKATEAAPRLLKAAEGLTPRGTFTNDELGIRY